MKMEQIAEQVKTQNNCATAAPYFVVQQQVRDWHIVESESDGYIWHNDAGQECDDDVILQQLDDGAESEEWTKCCYRRRWEFVTAALTKQGCEEYLERNGHNLAANVRIYAECCGRNEELKTLRAHFLGI